MYFQYISQYALLVLSPIVILGAFAQFGVVERLRESFFYQMEKQVISNVGRQEQLFFSMDSIILDIARNEAYEYEKNLKNIYESQAALKRLQGYTLGNMMIREVALWIEDDDYAYISEGTTYKMERLPERYPVLSQKIIEQMTSEDIKGASQYRWIQSGDSAAYYANVYRNGEKIIVLFVMDLSIINMNDLLIVSKGSGTGNFINMSSDLEECLRKGEEPDGYIQVKIEGENRDYIQYIPNDRIMGEFRKLLLVYHVVIILALCVGMGMIFIIVKRSLIPLIQSKEMMTDSAGVGMLYKALTGKYTKEEMERNIEKHSLIYLKGNFFFILLFQLTDISARYGKESLESICRRELPGYLVEMPEGKYVYLGSITECQIQNYKEAAHHIWKEMEKETNEDISFSVGPLFDNVQDIQKKYVSAVLALEYRFSMGNSCYVDSDSVFDEALVGNIYPKKQIEKLLLNVKLADMEAVNAQLDEICEYIKSHRLPVIYAKGICHELVISLTEILQSTGIMGEEGRLSYTNILTRSDTVEELAVKIRNIANNICISIQEKKKQNEELRIADMESFISENALLEKFSLQFMADHFGLSPSSLSNIYKAETGMTIGERVAGIRMEKAEELLRENVYTLDEIVEKIGYNNVSSFIRKFKNTYGVTPKKFCKGMDYGE